MVPDTRALAEWRLDLTLDGVTHRIVLVARGRDGVRTTIEAGVHRRTLTTYRLLDTDKPIRVDWGDVTEWTVEGIALHRVFPGPGTP